MATSDSAGAAPGPPVSARLDPAVAVAADSTASATLLVERNLSRKLDGVVCLTAPGGWRVDRAEFELSGVFWRQPYRAELRFTAEGQPGAACGRIALRSAEFDGDFDLPLVRLGDGRAVELRETVDASQRVLTIDNGRLALDVTPGFGGTLSALREGATDHLSSPFPHVATFGWLSPWYGGVTPIVVSPGEGGFPGKVGQASFAAEPIASADRQGITWRGVRQRADLSQDKLRGLTLELDTLTVGGSPVVKLALRLINTTPIVRRLDEVGWVAFVQPDGSRASSTLWGPEQQLKHSDRITWLKTGHWVAAQNPATGRALALISPAPHTGISGWGSEGGHLELISALTVPANGAAELVCYLVVADDIDSVRRFAALKDVR
jgi:hypothetical protein